jgi:hypothetical protein
MIPRRFASLVAAAALGAMVGIPATPARAGVTTAAWAIASTYCRSLAAGLSYPEARRIAISDNLFMWGKQMRDRALWVLVADELARQCPQLLPDQ